MNQKGFTLVELLAVIVIISLIMLITYPNIIKIINDNNKEIYAGYERAMVEYAKVSPLRTKSPILLSELNTDNSLDGIKDAGCNGYVVVNHTTDVTYQAFIRCADGNYLTCYEKIDHTKICYDESLQTDE